MELAGYNLPKEHGIVDYGVSNFLWANLLLKFFHVDEKLPNKLFVKQSENSLVPTVDLPIKKGAIFLLANGIQQIHSCRKLIY